jgi:hypothetical protein
MTFLSVAGAACVVAQLGLLARGRRYLAWLANGLASATFLAVGILQPFAPLIWISTANFVGLFLLWFWRGGPRRRKRARKQLGDESRQLRDGLVRRMRQRRVTRPAWSPSPVTGGD